MCTTRSPSADLPGETPRPPSSSENPRPTSSTTATITTIPAATWPGAMSQWYAATAAIASTVQAISRSIVNA